MMKRWYDSVSVYIVLLSLYFLSGSLTVGKIQKHSSHHHLGGVCLTGHSGGSLGVPVDVAFGPRAQPAFAVTVAGERKCCWTSSRGAPNPVPPICVVVRKHPLAIPFRGSLRSFC